MDASLKRGKAASQDDETGGLGQLVLEALACFPIQAVDNKSERKLPKGLGQKSLSLQGTSVEAERLRGYLQEQLVAQSAPRVSSRRSFSTATWRPELGLALVTTKKGSHWSTHGHTHSGELMLEAHEALFLMEMGCLGLEAGGLPMTLQQAYYTLIGDTLPLQQYMVLASLKRAGYVAKRVYVSNLSPQRHISPHNSHTVIQATPIPANCRLPLQLLPSCPLCHPPSSPSSAQNCCCLLEVHQPKEVYRKSNPGPPNFRVCVFSPQDPFPSAPLLKQLSAVTPLAPLHCCVVDGSCMTYYTLTQGSVPSP